MPLVQVAVALVLLLLGHAHDRALVGLEYPFMSPETTLCYAISAPALLFRFCGVRLWEMMRLSNSASAEIIVDDALFVFGVGLLWHVVGRVIDSRGQKEASLTFLSTPFRTSLDLFLVLIGIALGVVGLGARQYKYGLILVAFYLLWSLAIVVFYGLDFLLCVRGSATRAG